ncbi:MULTISPECIES: DUF5926 family protein [unclassified Parafrankia]|uniref:DUF5926 family protein n=1 Tax=Parafrankia TaxID=2994362 RepID=UPI000DD48042|nr:MULTISPECIES: DUF5926 family protein [unclassified Parafrankia]TCJ35284.1 hypothetical protein E0504_27505 [Parafrankia sp. BMG5.11]
MARRTTPSRPGSATATALADVPAVGPRQPCPCGSGRRYKACHGERRRAAPVLRPFAGRADEPDLVALREFVPSATAPLTLSAEHLAAHPGHADRRIILGTLLPQAAPAVVRDDGEILLAMQTLVGGLDASADVAGALIAALEAKPGTVVDGGPASAPQAVERLPGGLADLPRLADLLDPAPLEITVHPGFTWWVPSSEDAEPSADVVATLDRANATVVPTTRLASVPAAYWCSPGDRLHLRWVLPLDADRTEEALLDALARLAAAGSLSVGEGSRFVGSFRADGLVVPVWDLAPGADADSCEKPAAQLWTALRETLDDQRELTAQERRVRAGVVGRTLTLR